MSLFRFSARHLIVALCWGWICIVPASRAAVITLPVLDPTQVNSVFKGLASASIFRSLEPPSHPKVFGMWFNLRGGVTNSSDLSSLLGTSSTTLPFGAIQGGINGPFGLGVEFGFLPSPEISNTSLSSFGFGAKWSVGAAFAKMLPINLALRFLYSSAGVKYQQSISGFPIAVDYSSHSLGGTLDIGKTLIFFEPYVGIGLGTYSSTLLGQGTVTLFNTQFPVSTNSVDGSSTSLWLKAGFEMRLFVMTLGGQYDRIFDSDTLSAKVGFKF